MISWDENYIPQMERTVAQRVQAAGYMLLSKWRENVSVAGTIKAASGFTGLGRHYTREQQGPVESGAQFVPGSRSYITAFGAAGKKYRKGRRIYGSNPSKPGEYPHKQRGWLRQSGATSFDAATCTSRVGSPSRVARDLELGTKNIRPRKGFRATLAENKENIVKMITTGEM